MKNTILIGLAILTFGCSGGMDDEESSQAFLATQMVLSQGVAQVNTSGPADTLIINHSFNCLEGGAATFTGSVENSGSNSEFSYEVDFANCVSQGITIDGSMNYSLSFEENGNQSFKTVYIFRGDLSYSGQVEGSCQMDVVSTSDVNQGGASFTYVGSICGNDATTTLNQKVSF